MVTMLAVAKKPTPAAVLNEREVYRIDDAWRENIKARLAKRGEHAKLARTIGCAPSRITDILKGSNKYSEYITAINEHFNIPAPASSLMSKDVQEVKSVLDDIGSEGVLMLEDIRAIEDRSSRQAVIKAIRALVAAQISRR